MLPFVLFVGCAYIYIYIHIYSIEILLEVPRYKYFSQLTKKSAVIVDHIQAGPEVLEQTECEINK